MNEVNQINQTNGSYEINKKPMKKRDFYKTQVKIPYLFMSLQAKRSNLIYKESSGKLKTQPHISKEVGYVKDTEYQERT